MSCFGLPAALFCLGGFLRAGEFTKSGPFDPSVHLSPADLHLPTFRASEFLLELMKTDPLWQGCCPTTFASGDLVLVLFFAFKMASLFPGLGYCHFCNPAFRLLAFQFSGHSFRIGPAATAAQKGLPDHVIKRLGCWSSVAYQWRPSF